MEEKIKQIISEIFEISSVSDECSQENTESWDSLGHLRLMVALEEEFGISIEPEENISLISYSDIMLFIKKK